MSDETKTNKNNPLFAENLRRAEDALCGMANAVPDAVTDSWMQKAGFSALSATNHGQKLVREVMRAALTHVAAPIVAEQWLIKAELENQRDARTAPPESQVRATCLSLPDAVPFFDEQLDVQALLAEVARAHEQDRPCFGGQPQMIDRLAHIIRTYRGMETRDSSVRIGVAPAGHSMETVTETGAWLTLAAECDKRIDAGSVARWFRENGVEELPKNITGVMPDFCRWVARKAAFGLLEAARKEHEIDIAIRREKEERADAADAQIAEARRILLGAGAPDKPLVDQAKYAASDVRELADIRAIVRPGHREITSIVVKKMHEAYERMANERGRIHRLLTGAGFQLESDNMADGVKVLFDAVETALDKADFLSSQIFVERLGSFVGALEKRDTALITFWQDIRTIVGPVDVTDADREAVTEADAANGPDAREYYAERKALMRRIAENAGGVKNLSQLRQRDMAARLRMEEELSEIRDVLSKAGHTVDTHEQLMGVLLALAGEDAPLESSDEAQANVASVWHSKYSNSYNRRLVELLSAYAYAGDADVRDVMNALPMPHVRARITALIHAIETLAIAHGMDVTDHLQ